MELLSELSSLPLIEKFKSLKIGDDVFSRKYGLGKFAAIYSDDIIVDFNGRKIRIPAKESDLSLLPPDLKKKQRAKIGIEVDGQKMGIRGVKQIVKNDFISVPEVADIFSMSVEEVLDLCQRSDIKVHQFGRIRKIKKQDLLELQNSRNIEGLVK